MSTAVEMMFFVALLVAATQAQMSLTLEQPLEVILTSQNSGQYTFAVGSTITASDPALFFYLIPCIGRIDSFLGTKGDVSESNAQAKQIWVDGQDSLQKFFKISTATVDTKVNLFYKGRDQFDYNGQQIWGRFKILASRDPQVVAKLQPSLPNNGNVDAVVSGERNANNIVTVTFTKFAADSKFNDQYTVYTRETDFESAVKNVLNGCSIGQELKAVSPQPVMTDKEGKTSFKLNNTHTSDDKPPFIIGIQAIRTLASAGSDIQPEPVMYKLVTVGMSKNAPGRNGAQTSTQLCTVLLLASTVIAIASMA